MTTVRAATRLCRARWLMLSSGSRGVFFNYPVCPTSPPPHKSTSKVVRRVPFIFRIRYVGSCAHAAAATRNSAVDDSIGAS